MLVIKKKMWIFFYIIKQGFRGMFKNGFMIFASITVIFVSLFILGMFELTSVNLQSMMDKLADKPQIRIDLESEISQEAEQDIEAFLKTDSRVEEYIYISKKEQFERLKETFADKQDLFEGYDENLLYVSYEVKLADPVQGDEFTNELKNKEGVNYVTDILNVVSMFTSIKSGIGVGSLVVILVMGVLSVLLVVNTIKLTAIARRNELEIMSFIGASSSYTRGPFLIEGLLLGVISGYLAFLAIKYVYGVLDAYFIKEGFFNNFIELIDFSSAAKNLLLYFLLAGIIVGGISSMLTIRKYVKV